MAGNYIIASNATYHNAVLPDSVITSMGLPLVITSEDGEGNVTESPHAWTFETSLKASPYSKAAPAFPIVVRDPLPPLRELDDDNPEFTDWVCPNNNQGGNVHEVVMALAGAASVPYKAISLSRRQVLTYLATGELPS